MRYAYRNPWFCFQGHLYDLPRSACRYYALLVSPIWLTNKLTNTVKSGF
jgi:hypothetical protein